MKTLYIPFWNIFGNVQQSFPKARSMRIVGASLCVTFLLLLSACEKKGEFTREQYREAATALFEQQLYTDAIAMYEAYLHSSAIQSEDIPKVLYQMGNIYLENLIDSKAALAKYTTLKAMYPHEDFNHELGKKMVACLENSGRSLDAKQARSQLTEIAADNTQASIAAGATVVAEVEGRKITLNEVASIVGKLPEAPLELNQLIRQYVAQILIAEAARRKGLADKPEMKLKVQQIENQILAQASLQEELKITPPSGNDLKYYFEANKARYLVGADSLSTFEKLAPKVQADWAREKQGTAYQAYVEKLLQTSKVTFFNPSEKK